MKITRLNLPEIVLLEPKRLTDQRGFFSEVYNRRAFADAGLGHGWIQDNHALSREKGTLRGLHFQSPPHAQAKLVRVTRGSIFDVAVDIRVDSPTFAQWVSAIVSAEAWNQLLIPKGFAHGYLTLEPDTEVLYKVDSYYAPEADGGVIWNDPDLAIDWPLHGIEPIVSGKDQALPTFSGIESPFHHDG